MQPLVDMLAALVVLNTASRALCIRYTSKGKTRSKRGRKKVNSPKNTESLAKGITSTGDYVLWTKEIGEQLVMEDFPWFWNTWSNYTHWVSLLP